MGKDKKNSHGGHIELELSNEYLLNSVFCVKNPTVHRVSLALCIFEN